MAEEKIEIVRGARIAVPPLTDRVRQHRTLDQRLNVRFPALYRLLVGTMVHLSPRSRLRRFVSELVFQLFTVRRGLIVRQEDFLDRSEALEAAGVRE